MDRRSCSTAQRANLDEQELSARGGTWKEKEEPSGTTTKLIRERGAAQATSFTVPEGRREATLRIRPSTRYQSSSWRSTKEGEGEREKERNSLILVSNLMTITERR